MLNFIMCRDLRYKKEAVQRHREMWNWIADQVEKDGLKPLSDIKELAVRELHPEDLGLLEFNCYLCTYASYRKRKKRLRFLSKCYCCPVEVDVEQLSPNQTGYKYLDDCLGSLYSRARDLSWDLDTVGNREKFVRVARTIANLQESRGF